MSKKKVIRETYQCSKCGRQVTITKIINSIILQGITVKKDIVGTDCDGKDICGVGTKNRSGFSYDWSKCVHPLMKRRP